MRIAQVNNYYFKTSVGTIMNSIAQYGWLHGEAIYSFVPLQGENLPEVPGLYYMGTLDERDQHQKMAEQTGLNGFYSENATKQMLDKFDELDIQLIHLHDIHSFSFNFKLLFDYIHERKIPVVWTLHCCWPFTGKCTYFTSVKCDRWKDKCYDCPQLNVWPKSLAVDNSSTMYQWKKEHFGKIQNMTLVAPSDWIAGLTRHSFLAKFPVEVIHNGINTWRFSPTESDFREKYGLQDKVILLGVAAGWGYRKGFDTMCRLSEQIGKKYQVVLVGNAADGSAEIPNSILFLPYTENPVELAKIYSAADFFINPTREENYPTVNMEALACGTPVITYNTGGSPEIPDETCGRIVPYDDLEALILAIEEETQSRRLTREACLKRAKLFDQDIMCKAYMELYRKML